MKQINLHKQDGYPMVLRRSDNMDFFPSTGKNPAGAVNINLVHNEPIEVKDQFESAMSLYEVSEIHEQREAKGVHNEPAEYYDFDLKKIGNIRYYYDNAGVKQREVVML